MTTPSDPRLLRKAIDDTRHHLAELTNPQVRSYVRDQVDEDGTVVGIGETTRHPVPSLLQQLRRAVASTNSSGGGPSKHAPIPISADAHDLLADITLRSAELVLMAGARPASNSIEDRLAAVVREAGQWTDYEAVAGVRLALSKWVARIHDLLDPPKRLYLAAPCPRCEVSMVWRRDDATGESVQQPALQVDGKTGCTCLNCAAHWDPSLFEHLASVLGCPPLGGVA